MSVVSVMLFKERSSALYSLLDVNPGSKLLVGMNDKSDEQSSYEELAVHPHSRRISYQECRVTNLLAELLRPCRFVGGGGVDGATEEVLRSENDNPQVASLVRLCTRPAQNIAVSIAKARRDDPVQYEEDENNSCCSQ